jgi:hypothetical protein
LEFIHDIFNKELNPVGFSSHLVQDPLSFCTGSETGTASQVSACRVTIFVVLKKGGLGGGAFFNVSFKILQVYIKNISLGTLKNVNHAHTVFQLKISS